MTESGGLTARVASGLRWSTLDTVGGQVVRFAVTVVLTRLVAPENFGLLAMALVFTQLASLLGDLGFGPALVQRKEVEPRHVRTATTVTTAVGLLLALLVVALAGVISGFFNEPDLRPVVAAVGATFLLRGIAGVPKDMLRRHMHFQFLAAASVIAVTAGGVTAVVMAVTGAEVWALVAQVLVENVMLTVFIGGAAVVKRVWMPVPGFDRRALSDIARFGAFVSGTRIVHYGVTNIDNLIVGKVLGSTALGLYNLAYRLMLVPVSKIADVVANVTTPAFARLQDEPERLANAYRKAVVSIGLVAFPLSVGTSIAAPALVPAVFGARWDPAVLAVQILALNGVRLVMTRMNGVVYEAKGKPSWDLGMMSVTLAAYGVGFAIGVHWDIEGVAVAMTAVGYLLLPLDLALVHKLMKARLRTMLGGLVPVLAATAAMAIAAGVVMVVSEGLNAMARSALVVPAAIVAYVIGLMVFAPGLLQSTGRELAGRSQS